MGPLAAPGLRSPAVALLWTLAACSPGAPAAPAPPAAAAGADGAAAPLANDTASTAKDGVDTAGSATAGPSDVPANTDTANTDSLAAAETAAATGPSCPDCDDDNVCTYDLCQPKTAACSHIPLPATTTCATDEDPCTAEWCTGTGACAVYATGDCP